MPLTQLDTGGIARSLSQIADRAGDHVDVFLEVQRETRVRGAAEALVPSTRREEGLAVRLLRDGRTWLASRDEVSPVAFSDAVGRVARARPGAVARPPKELTPAPTTPEAADRLIDFIAAVEQAITSHHAAFPVVWDVSHHRRVSRVVGAMLSPGQQDEHFFSCRATMPWARWGGLLPDLEPGRAEAVARSLITLFRARKSTGPVPGRQNVVLGPGATAVLLHEAVAHALETDTLALSGDPEAVVGIALAPPEVEVVDDPAGAPAGVGRTVDDEGIPTVRRWLLRAGTVEQPLADVLRGVGSRRLIPGAGRRGSRHLPPVPRSTHLELLAGRPSREDLWTLCGDGLLIDEFSGGTLDPLSGAVRLDFAAARRLAAGRPTESVGAGSLRGAAIDLLAGVRAVGDDLRFAGAGWCAKGGHRLPVWATAPSLLLAGVEVGA